MSRVQEGIKIYRESSTTQRHHQRGSHALAQYNHWENLIMCDRNSNLAVKSLPRALCLCGELTYFTHVLKKGMENNQRASLSEQLHSQAWKSICQGLQKRLFFLLTCVPFTLCLTCGYFGKIRSMFHCCVWFLLMPSRGAGSVGTSHC